MNELFSNSVCMWVGGGTFLLFCYLFLEMIVNGPRREKTCLPGFRKSVFQTSLLSYRDQLENRNFTCNKITYDTFQKQITKALTSLRGSAHVLFTNLRRQVF